MSNVQHAFFQGGANPVAVRHPRSERLILGRLLGRASENRQLDDEAIDAAHAVLIRWADLESSGRLAGMHENQLQGEFLREVFGDALGYKRPTEGAEEWEVEQHWNFFGGEPDAILGRFHPHEPREPVGVIELKGPGVHLDRDRSSGRTAVQQCWDYLDNLPGCRWGIVSNIVSFRLYERNHTARRYEHFTLQELRDAKTFRRFYVLLERYGLLRPTLGQPPRADSLLRETDNRQREVGGVLYEEYSRNRLQLIHHLHFERKHDLDAAIGMAQQLLDRIVFIAFCEDRGLLPENTLRRAHDQLPGFTDVVNPRWRQYKNLFRFIDRGHPSLQLDEGYNGGLFAASPADDLDLDDKWTHFFRHVGGYDFRDEVNLDVLGHLFEQSVTELEKLRQGDLFGGEVREGEPIASMPQSARRKRLGIYYTPPAFTEYIVRLAVGERVEERFAAAAVRHGMSREAAERGDTPDDAAFWREALGLLRALKVCDPACGSGAFLFQAYELLEGRYQEVIDRLGRLGEPDAEALAERVPDFILHENLYGVDLSREAVEITQLALWIRSAQRGRTLADLSHNIRYGNSLVADPEADADAFDWRAEFPEVFEREAKGFDAVIGNPPWERMKLQEREFFALSAPRIATAANAAQRRRMIATLEAENPNLHRRYLAAKADADRLLSHCRRSGDYPLTGRGDINTYVVFAELASKIVAPSGRVCLLVPSGIASDHTTKEFFASLAGTDRLIRLYDFENRKGLFPDVHRSFKFSILHFGGEATCCKAADFVFFAHGMADVHDLSRHVALSGEDIRLVNPNTRTCPIFRSRRDAELTKRIYRNVPVLIDRSRRRGGNPWGIRFKRMFDQTNDAEWFREAETLRAEGATLEGNRWVNGERVYLPLYEAKMFERYDHRFGSMFTKRTNWNNQGQSIAATLVEHQNPEYLAQSRWWIDKSEVEARMQGELPPALLSFRDITNPTNQRTMLSTFLPVNAFTNKVILVRLGQTISVKRSCCLLACFNSFIFDYVVRQKMGGISLNFYIVEQLPTLPPERYGERCPWDARRTLEEWISERVLKLTCTAEDMLGLAEAADFTGGDLGGYGGRLHKWKPGERAQLLAELDAAYFLLYGVEREDAAYILSTFHYTREEGGDITGAGRSAGARVLDAYDWFLAQRVGRGS